MAGRKHNDYSDTQNYNRNSGYESRFGSAGMKGPHRYSEFEPETYGSRGGGRGANQMTRAARGDYSTFEGATDRPYYGGEEGNFPYGGASYNADERRYSDRGQHAGKGPKGYRRADERIHDDVCERLTAHGDIDASEIEVDVKEGIVDLTGTVESRQIKRMVEDVVDRVSGVRDIRNNLRILAHEDDPQAASQLARSSGEEQNFSQSSTNSKRSMNKDRSSRSRAKASSSRQVSQ